MTLRELLLLAQFAESYPIEGAWVTADAAGRLLPDAAPALRARRIFARFLAGRLEAEQPGWDGAIATRKLWN